jgi:hypothetical protein
LKGVSVAGVEASTGKHLDSPAPNAATFSKVYMRDVRPSRERANTNNAAFIGIVRGVRDVRSLG